MQSQPVPILHSKPHQFTVSDRTLYYFFFQIFKDQTEPKAPLKHSHLVKALNRNLGGDKRDRTVDPLLAKQVLSQLSYAPVCQSYRGGS